MRAIDILLEFATKASDALSKANQNSPEHSMPLSSPQKAVDPFLPERATLREIWKAYPDLDRDARNRVRVNLNNAVRGRPGLEGKRRAASGKWERDYPARLVREIVAKERETPRK